LREVLTFHASFNNRLDADMGLGDRKLYSAPSLSKRAEAKAGLPSTGEIILAQGQGHFGHALRFTKKKSPLVFFQAQKNIAFQPTNWNGTVSFWLSTDPEKDLEPGFCDPIQITPRAWNDAAFFVEFEKRAESIPFRLGVYSDLKVWNPQNRKWADVPLSEKPLVTVEKPPFREGKWTHVLFTFENFNTGASNGIARLYLDGKFQGALSPRQQTFTWDPAQTLVMLGLSYVGFFDELSIFKRPLSDSEIEVLYQLKGSLAPME